MNSIVGLISASFAFLISFYHISGVGNYFLAQRAGILLWHFWAIGILGCLFLAILSKHSFRLPKGSITYLIWSGLFMLAAGSSLLFVSNGQVAIDTITRYVWFFAVTISLVFFVRSPVLKRAVGYGAVLAVVVMSVLTVIEFFDPNFQVIVDRLVEDKYEVGEINRAGAFHINPNENGIAIVLAMFAGVFFLPSKLRFPFILLAGVAIFATVSRGALTAWAIATFLCFFMGYISKGSILVKSLGVVFVCGLASLLVSGQVPGLMADAGIDQFLSEDMRDRLSENFFTQEDGSAQGRKFVAAQTLDVFTDNPIAGVGIGATDSIGDVGSHNQHLKIAAEMGVFGYLIFCGLFLVALFANSAAAVIFVLLYFAVSLTNHTMLYEPIYAVLIPLSTVFIPSMLQEAPPAKSRRRRRRRRSASHSERRLSA